MSDSTDDSRRATATDDVSRRRLLRASGGVAAAAIGLPAVSGAASAQSEEEDEEQDTIYTDGVLSNSTPKLGNSDFTGLYLTIEDPQTDPDTTGVSSCSVIESDDRVAAYNATISDNEGADTASETEETTVYIPAQDSTVGTGKQFLVNSQTECSGGYTSVRLEQVGSASIETAASGAGDESTDATTTSSYATDEPESETTAASSPGFSALTGVLGVGAAGLAALKRASGGDNE